MISLLSAVQNREMPTGLCEHVRFPAQAGGAAWTGVERKLPRIGELSLQMLVVNPERQELKVHRRKNCTSKDTDLGIRIL